MRRVALVLIGLVLLVAGGLKVWALSGPVDTLGWPRELIVAGSAVELLLGFWLISGVAIRAAHLAAIGIFLLFAALSTYQVIRGVPSCGCLGKLYVHPASSSSSRRSPPTRSSAACRVAAASASSTSIPRGC